MNKTSKELTPLEAIQEYKRVTCHNCQYKDKENCDVVCFSNIIEQALKQAEKDKEMLDIFKNSLTIKRGDTNVIYNDCGGLVEILFDIEKNELDEKLQKSLREWVLENAFPKELKALETIKKHFKFRCLGISPHRDPSLDTCFVVTENIKEVPIEKWKLLKEVLEDD